MLLLVVFPDGPVLQLPKRPGTRDILKVLAF